MKLDFMHMFGIYYLIIMHSALTCLTMMNGQVKFSKHTISHWYIPLLLEKQWLRNWFGLISPHSFITTKYYENSIIYEIILKFQQTGERVQLAWKHYKMKTLQQRRWMAGRGLIHYSTAGYMTVLTWYCWKDTTLWNPPMVRHFTNENYYSQWFYVSNFCFVL